MCKGAVAAPRPCEDSIPDFRAKSHYFLVKNVLITERKFFALFSHKSFYHKKPRRWMLFHLRG